ncbi:MAG: hypothetical protein IJO50_00920 [Clostridia bacterium]|nr:hypothetical protein [Clostridia bacterium]
MLQLAEKLVHILSSRWKSTGEEISDFYVIDLTQIPSRQLECYIRSKIPFCHGLTYLITDFSDETVNEILVKLCNRYPQLCPIPRSELLRLLSEKEVPDVFSQNE